MKKVEVKKLADFFNKYPSATRVFDKIVIVSSLLEDNAELYYDPNDELSIKEFILTNYSKINFKKLLLLGVYGSNKLVEYYNKSDYRIYRDRYVKFAKENISENEDVLIFLLNIKDRAYIEAINSKKEIYHKGYKPKELKLEKYFDDFVVTVTLENLKYLFEDENLSEKISQILSYNSLRNMGYTMDDIQSGKIKKGTTQSQEFFRNFIKEAEKLFNIPEIKSQILEDDFYAIAAYQYIENMNISIDNYKTHNDYDIMNIDAVIGLEKAFKAIEQLISVSKVDIQIRKNGSEEDFSNFSLDKFRQDYKDALDKYGKIFIDISKAQLLNTDVIGLLKKETALNLLNDMQDEDLKCEYYYILYQVGFVTYKEMFDFNVNHGTEAHEIAIRTLLGKLTNRSNVSSELLEKLGYNVEDAIEKNKNSDDPIKEINTDNILDKILDPKVLFSASLIDKSIYEILDDKLKLIYATKSMEEYIQKGEYSDIALANINVLLKNNDINNDFLRIMYGKHNISIDDLEVMIGENRLRQMINSSEFVKLFKEIREMASKEDKSEKDKETYEIMLKEYDFYRKLYTKFNCLSDKNLESNLINELDDLIFDEKIFELLYLDGFISGKTLYELNQDLAIKLYNSGNLRVEDKGYVISNPNVEVKVGDIIRLNDEQVLSQKDIIDFYMKGRISLNDLKLLSEDIDLKTIFRTEDLLEKAKRYSLIRKEEIKEDFEKYIDAYSCLVGYPEEEVQKKLFKLLSGRNSDIIDLYSKRMIDLKNFSLDDLSNSLLIELIRSGNDRAEDDEYLFRDTEVNGIKYLRLAQILDELNNDQRINLLASVYEENDPISEKRLDYLVNYLDDAVNERDGHSKKIKSAKHITRERLGLGSDDSNKTKTKIRALRHIFATFNEIKPDYEHLITSGTYIINLDDHVIVEQIYKTTSDGRAKKFTSEHATYIISRDYLQYLTTNPNISLYRAILNEMVQINKLGDPYFDWEFLTKSKKLHAKGIEKCLHIDNEAWKRNLKKKLGIRDEDYDRKVKDTLDMIKQNKGKQNNFDGDIATIE